MEEWMERLNHSQRLVERLRMPFQCEGRLRPVVRRPGIIRAEMHGVSLPVQVCSGSSAPTPLPRPADRLVSAEKVSAPRGVSRMTGPLPSPAAQLPALLSVLPPTHPLPQHIHPRHQPTRGICCAGSRDHDLMSRTWNAVAPTTNTVALAARRMISDCKISAHCTGL